MYRNIKSVDLLGKKEQTVSESSSSHLHKQTKHHKQYEKHMSLCNKIRKLKSPQKYRYWYKGLVEQLQSAKELEPG